MRIWTVDQANRALPRVRMAVERIGALAAAVRSGAGERPATAAGNGHAKAGGSAFELQAELDALGEQGIVLRDVDAGLVDFPAKSPSGRTYFLCWLSGEPEVAWWHWPESGFAGRRPLSDPPG